MEVKFHFQARLEVIRFDFQQSPQHGLHGTRFGELARLQIDRRPCGSLPHRCGVIRYE